MIARHATCPVKNGAASPPRAARRPERAPSATTVSARSVRRVLPASIRAFRLRSIPKPAKSCDKAAIRSARWAIKNVPSTLVKSMRNTCLPRWLRKTTPRPSRDVSRSAAPSPSASITRIPFGLSCNPAPTSRISGACSNTRTFAPRIAAARAVASPATPPPTTSICMW